MALDLAEKILEAKDVLVGPFQPPFGLLLATSMFEDAGGLLDHGPMILRRGVEDRIDLALSDNDVLMATNT